MKKAIIMLSFAAVLAGCDTVNTVEPANPAAVRAVIPDKRVITDSSLNRLAFVRAVNVGKAGGKIRVQAEVMNRTSDAGIFVYKFEWFDAEGMLVSSPLSNWRTQTILGKESLFVEGIAPTDDAVDFRLKLAPDMKDQ